MDATAKKKRKLPESQIANDTNDENKKISRCS